MMIFILILYFFSAITVGFAVIKKIFALQPGLLSVSAAFLVGTGLTVPATYFLSILYSRSSTPIVWAVISIILISALFFARYVSYNFLKKITVGEIIFVSLTLAFSAWMMMKTFHGGPGGVLYVGSNNVFDFGFGLGIIRSFSYGANIPIMSPFESGAPFFYHFFFYFWVAIWEYFGVPIVWAMNVPSILSFAAMLSIIYYLPQILLKQKPIAGWIAVLLTVTNSSLTFWHVLFQKGISMTEFKNLWHLSVYPFAGPFDGGAISLYVTLNNYVNQRHLSFSIALGLLLYMMISKKLQDGTLKKLESAYAGALVGFMLLWNIPICILLCLMLAMAFVYRKKWSLLWVCMATALITAVVINLPDVPYFITTFIYLSGKIQKTMPAGVSIKATWNIFEYLWQNLGILPLVAGLGFLWVSRKGRAHFFPFVLLMIAECAVAAVGKRGFDQKFYSFLVIGMNVLAAAAVVRIWNVRSWYTRAIAASIVIIMTVSGFIDLLPVKNEFAFPLIRKELVPVMSWIQKNTDKKDVFVSYADIIDPVVLSGRRNYFGFFGNIGWKYRTEQVRRIYGGDVAFARTEGVTYILIPKWQRSDFPYVIHTGKLESAFTIAYNDADFLILKVP